MDTEPGQDRPEIVEPNGAAVRVVPQAHGGALHWGRGRPKGALARWSKAALREVEKVYKALGGAESMVAWARENPSDFYRGIYSKLLPTQFMVDAKHSHQVEPANLTDADLLRIVSMATKPDILNWAADQARDQMAIDQAADQVHEQVAAAHSPDPDQDRADE
jgi:hypothetical protein